MVDQHAIVVCVGAERNRISKAKSNHAQYRGNEGFHLSADEEIDKEKWSAFIRSILLKLFLI